MGRFLLGLFAALSFLSSAHACYDYGFYCHEIGPDNEKIENGATIAMDCDDNVIFKNGNESLTFTWQSATHGRGHRFVGVSDPASGPQKVTNRFEVVVDSPAHGEPQRGALLIHSPEQYTYTVPRIFKIECDVEDDN